MQVNSSSGNLYSVAPGTANSKIKPEANLSYEQSNAAVDKAKDTVQEAKSNVQQAREARRTAAADVYQNQQQQKNVERYIESSTGEESDSGSNLTYENLQSASRSYKASQLASAASEASSRTEERPDKRPEETPADRLQNRINDLVGNSPSKLPELDVFA